MDIGVKLVVRLIVLFAVVVCLVACFATIPENRLEKAAFAQRTRKFRKVERDVDPRGKRKFIGKKLNKKLKLANQHVLRWKGKTITAIGTSANDPPEKKKFISDELKKRPLSGKSCRVREAHQAVQTVHLGPKVEGALPTDFEPCSERKRAAKSGKTKPPRSKGRSSAKQLTLKRNKRSESYAATNWLWSDPENIPLVYDSSFPQDQLSTAKAAREMWENYTCIQFSEQSTPPSAGQPYVLLTTGGGACTTDRLGPNWYSPYTTKVDATTCSTTVGSLSHELGHVLGLTHSQSRVDRNAHLTFFGDNVPDNWKSQFDVDDVKYFSAWGVPFYYDSIMEYFPYAASTNSLMTLCPLDPLMETLMGQRIEPVLGDYSIINRMYCQESCFNRSQLANSFSGQLSMTIGGRTCQRWSSQTPHAHNFSSVGDHDYCRNPDNWSGGPWCYTNDPSIPYEPCFSACEDLAARNKPHCEGWCYNGGYHNPDSCECVCPAFTSGKFCDTTNEALKYTHLTCGGRIDLTTGQTYVIASPNYPQNYSSNAVCMWWLKAPENATIQVTVNDFDIEVPDQTGCYDYLEVRRSLCAPAYRTPETMRYCGDSLSPDPSAGPHQILSDDNDLILKFVSDDNENDHGFSLVATVVTG